MSGSTRFSPSTISDLTTQAASLTHVMASPQTLPTPQAADRAVAAAQIGTWQWHLHTQRVEWSSEADAIFGLPAGAFDGTFDGFLSRIHPVDRPELEAAIHAAMATRQPYLMEHRIMLPDGTTRWVSCRGRAIAEENGDLCGMAGTIEDITPRKETERILRDLQQTLEQRVRERTTELEQTVQELEQEIARRRQTEAALSDSEQRYHTLYEQNPSMYFTLAPDGTVLSVNGFGAEELGYQASELLGRSVLSVFQPHDHQTVLSQLRICAGHPGQTFEWEIQKVRSDGRLIWVRERARAITDPRGRSMILVVCDDITDRRQTEEAIRESDARLRATTQFLHTLVRESPLPIVSLDADAKVTSWNQAATALFGWTEDEVLGRELPYVPQGQEAESEALWIQGLNKTVHGPLALQRQRKDGAMLDLLLWPMFVYDETAALSTAIGLYVDQSDLQRAEEELRESESRFRAFASAMPDLAFVLDEHGRYVEILGHEDELLYADASQLKNRLLHEILPQADADSFLAIIRKTVETGQSQHVEYPLKVKAGVLWFEGHTSLMQPVPGKIKQIVWVAHNITERKQAEVALRESERAIRSLQEATSSSGLTLDQRIQTVLELGCRRFQLPVGLMTTAEGDQLVITHAWDPDKRFAPGMQLPLCKSYCGTTLNESGPVAIDHAAHSEWQTHPGYQTLGLESYLGTKLVGEHRVFGTICFLSPTARQTPFTSAEKDFLLLIARWVSGELDRQTSEQALRVSEERFEVAFRSSPHPVVITELATGRCIEVNDTALRIFGFERHEAVGRTTIAIQLWPKPDDRTRFITQLLANGTLRGVEFSFQTKDRRLRHCLVSSELIELNGTRCILTVGTDVTEKKEAEAALRESEERWQRFVADAPVGLVVVDADKRIISANKAFCALTGYSEREVIDNTYALYTHPDDLPKNLELTEEFFSGQRDEYTYEKRYVRKDGKIIWVSIRASRLRVHGHDSPLLLAVVEDITDRKQALADRERISQDLHDNILQSLYAVGMQLEAGKLLAGKAPRKSKQHVTQAIRQLNHLVLEVRQFITDLTRRTAPTLDFTVALKQLVASFSSESHHAPALELDEHALAAIAPAIGEQLLNITREALSNSLRHATAAHRSVSLTQTHAHIHLRITDDGTGFDTARKRRRGHGLANMAARARTIQAQFTLDSAPGRGTCITIDVPTGGPHAR
ncbi:MAG: PAS domain S-box protein [Nitrospira sp.]